MHHAIQICSLFTRAHTYFCSLLGSGVPGSSGSITSFNHFVENDQTTLFEAGDNLLIRATAAIQVADDAPKLGEFFLHVKIYTLDAPPKLKAVVVHAEDTDSAIIGFGDSQIMVEDVNLLAPGVGAPDRYHTGATLYLIDARNNICPLDADEGQFREFGGR